MALSLMSVTGVAVLGGGLVAGLSGLVIAAVACLVAAGLLNGIRLLGELLDTMDVDGPTAGEDASPLHQKVKM